MAVEQERQPVALVGGVVLAHALVEQTHQGPHLGRVGGGVERTPEVTFGIAEPMADHRLPGQDEVGRDRASAVSSRGFARVDAAAREAGDPVESHVAHGGIAPHQGPGSIAHPASPSRRPVLSPKPGTVTPSRSRIET